MKTDYLSGVRQTDGAIMKIYSLAILTAITYQIGFVTT